MHNSGNDNGEQHGVEKSTLFDIVDFKCNLKVHQKCIFTKVHLKEHFRSPLALCTLNVYLKSSIMKCILSQLSLKFTLMCTFQVHSRLTFVEVYLKV